MRHHKAEKAGAISHLDKEPIHLGTSFILSQLTVASLSKPHTDEFNLAVEFIISDRYTAIRHAINHL